MKGIEGKLLKLRIAKGISKADMSRACEISPTAYSNIEEDITESINIETGRKIAKALGISFNDLFEIESNSPQIEGLNRQIEELQGRIDEYKVRIEEKDALLQYFSRTNRNIKSYLIKRMNAEFLAKWVNPENANDINGLWKSSENLQKQYEDFVFLGVLDQSDVDNAIKFCKRKQD